jgi:hypothetical protein
MEGVLAGVIPVLPDRCSYKEMYLPEFKYPSEWTTDMDAFVKHRQDLIDFMQDRIDNRDKYLPLLEKQKQILLQDYLQADDMIKNITNVDFTI